MCVTHDRYIAEYSAFENSFQYPRTDEHIAAFSLDLVLFLLLWVVIHSFCDVLQNVLFMIEWTCCRSGPTSDTFIYNKTEKVWGKCQALFSKRFCHTSAHRASSCRAGARARNFVGESWWGVLLNQTTWKSKQHRWNCRNTTKPFSSLNTCSWRIKVKSMIDFTCSRPSQTNASKNIASFVHRCRYVKLLNKRTLHLACADARTCTWNSSKNCKNE